MGLFDIFKKEKKQEKKMEECTGEADCPMCHIDDKTLEVLKESSKPPEKGKGDATKT